MIVLVRHGETEWSASGQHTSTTDLPLTEKGRAAATALRDRLAQYDFAAAFSSPMARAIETARLAGVSAFVDPNLREVNYGDYEGRTTKEIHEERPGWSLWKDGSPLGEKVEHAGQRVDLVISRALVVDGNVALFAHGHILRVLAARWIGLPAEFGAHLKLDTASLSVLGFERDTRVLTHWNT